MEFLWKKETYEEMIFKKSNILLKFSGKYKKQWFKVQLNEKWYYIQRQYW